MGIGKAGLVATIQVPSDKDPCHPPAAWDQVEGFSAMSMGPPGRQ
jgi:hypothetical protein